MGVFLVKGNLVDLIKFKYVFNLDVLFLIICFIDLLVCVWFFFLIVFIVFSISEILDIFFF